MKQKILKKGKIHKTDTTLETTPSRIDNSETRLITWMTSLGNHSKWRLHDKGAQIQKTVQTEQR